MKFFQHALPLALVLAMAASVNAAPAAASSSSLSNVEQSLVSDVQAFSSQLHQQDAKLKQLNANSVTADELKPITQVVVDIVDKVGAELNDALNKIKDVKGNEKRQALLVPAVTQLVGDLNTVLADAEPLLRHLTTNLELGTVQDLVDGLTPALATLVAGVEGLLTTLAPGLSTLVDPLLHTVYALTDALGLPLNLPSA